MGIGDWFRGRRPRISPSDQARAAETLERIVQLVNPRLRFAYRYRRRLLQPVLGTLEYAHSLVAHVPAAHEASRATWSADPAMRAFFAGPGDLILGFSRSPEVRAWFDNAAAGEVFAVLSMQVVERRALGVAVEQGIVRRDVAQTTISFADHRARICADSEAQLRQTLERRIVDQLALQAIAWQDEARSEVLEREHALLRTRVKLLEAQGVGLSALGADTAVAGSDLARAYGELAVNEANLRSIASGPQALEYQLERLRDILLNPQEHLFVSARCVRLDHMNVLVPDDAPGDAPPLDLQIARIPIPAAAPELRAFVLARFDRSELLPRSALLSDAARVLSMHR
jgi:hypothetical protein